MDITMHKIFDLLWKSNTDEQDLCKAIGISKSAMTDWKRGKTKSYRRHLSEIADFFKVDVSYLVNQEVPATPDKEQPELTEQQHLSKYASEMLAGLDVETLKAVIGILEKVESQPQ
jgi:transcriptional regulator with XRE-family HTH domain